MSKKLINFWWDLLLLVLFLLLLWSEVVVHIVFPPGPNAHGWFLWSWNYVQWSNFQFGVLCTLAAAVLIHVMLHWTWVCGVVTTHLVRDRDGRKLQLSEGARTLYGVGLLIALLHIVGFGLAAAWLTIQPPQT